MGTKTIIVCCILLISMLLLAGCHVWKGKKKPEEPIATEPPLPSAILGREKELQVKVAEEFVILAEGNITTGFSWFYCGKDTVDGVELKKNDYVTEETSRIVSGASGVFRFYFEAKKAGRYELKFENKRPWEKDVEPMVNSIVVVVE